MKLTDFSSSVVNCSMKRSQDNDFCRRWLSFCLYLQRNSRAAATPSRKAPFNKAHGPQTLPKFTVNSEHSFVIRQFFKCVWFKENMFSVRVAWLCTSIIITGKGLQQFFLSIFTNCLICEVKEHFSQAFEKTSVLRII